MKVPKHIEELMLWHLLDELSPTQENELWAWRRLSPDNEAIFQESADREKFRHGMRRMMESKEIIWQKLKQQYPMIEEDTDYKSHRRSKILRIALIGAAAVVIGFLGFRLWMNLMQIVPGQQQAYFFSYQGYSLKTLGNHKNAVALKDEVSLEEKDKGEKMLVAKNLFLATEADYEKLIVPAGNRFCLQLPDIGFIRLNAESWVSYPAKFNKDSVNLIASGEIFVDLVKSTKRTIWFNVRNLKIKASQASFNIQSHPGEMRRITLLSGQLYITGYPGAENLLQPILLQPGQQFIYQDSVARVINADTIAAAAWKNGRTYYRNENIRTIMRSLSRWYDFDYYIDPLVADKTFNLDQLRDAPIKDVLNELQQQNVHYSIGNRVITIKP